MITITFKGTNKEMREYFESLMSSHKMETLEKEVKELKEILRNSTAK